MKKNNRLITLITLAVTSAAIWISLSGFKLYIEESTTLGEEIRQYITDNVFPQLKEQRDKLDQILSSDEKAQITEMRNKLEALREERNTYSKDRIPGSPSEITPEMREEIMERRKRHAKVHREIMIEVFEIVNKHEGDIDQLLEPIEENMPDWKSDIRDILSEYWDQNNMGNGEGPYRGHRFRGKGMNAGFDESGNIGGRGRGVGYGGGAMGMGDPGGFMGPGAGQRQGLPGGFGRRGIMGFNFPMQPEKFVLFDPERMEKILNNDFSVLPTLSPNPTNGMVRINLELNKPEQVSINLYDRQGTQIRNLINKTMDKGKQELIFDVSDLSDGLYFYHINLENKVEKGRILIE